MTFQAYIDNIEAKTGKTPEDFLKIAGEARVARSPASRRARSLSGSSYDYGLGRGHAMAIYSILKPQIGR